MAEYDPNLIYQFADQMYRMASQTITSFAVTGVLVGGGIGYFFAGSRIGPAALLGAIIAGVIGYSFGSQRAFQMRVQAQTALCQVRIEENTRRGKTASESSVTSAQQLATPPMTQPQPRQIFEFISCPKCNAENSKTNLYCKVCGQRL